MQFHFLLDAIEILGTLNDKVKEHNEGIEILQASLQETTLNATTNVQIYQLVQRVTELENNSTGKQFHYAVADPGFPIAGAPTTKVGALTY